MRIRKQLFTLLVAILLPIFSLSAQDAKAGKSLFNANCAACHKLDARLVGPALSGVTKKYDKEWLYKWIKDNEALRKSGDKKAIKIYEEYNQMAMQAFPNLSNSDIDNILAYIENPPKEEPKKEEVAVAPVAKAESNDGSVIGIVLFAVGLLLIVMLIFLHSVRGAFYRLNDQENTPISAEISEAIRFFLRNKKFIGALALVLVIGGAKDIWGGMLSIGVDKGYQPVQPIAFSHKLHAGENKIDCNYCHSSARQSKHAGVPSANVCMNCHKLVQEGQTDEGTKEIAKIYDAIGFDKTTSSYIEGYEEKPIKWVKIHDLQDFVYFNHSQHVIAGKVECQTCHGPIQEMEEVYQYADLTMGWCINCHRETEVQTKKNPYYKKVHDQLAKKYNTEKLTVSMIGGLECGKCHY